MNNKTAIKCFSAIAHDGRLSLMKKLIKAGPGGLSSGALAQAQKINATTASAQLLTLSNAGLVTSKRIGKQVIYRAQFDKFQALVGFLMEECCREDMQAEAQNG